jgi:hypothetical protein
MELRAKITSTALLGGTIVEHGLPMLHGVRLAICLLLIILTAAQ